ncbi:MAG: OmpA family protein [Pseudomonadota bacterium]
MAEHTATHSRTTRRYMVRTAAHDRPSIRTWWPFLLALLLLYLWGAFVIAPDMQSDVREGVSQQLSAIIDADPGGLDVSSSGQNVAISTSWAASDEQLRAVAEGVRCNTWIGRLTCPIDVDIARREAPAQTADIQPSAAAAAEPIETAVPAQPAQPLVPAEHHDFSIRKAGGSFAGNARVAGVEDAHAAALDAAFGDGAGITIEQSTASALPGDIGAIGRARALLDLLERGSASYDNGVLSVAGLVSADREAAVRGLFNEPLDGVGSGDLALRVAAAIDTCNSDYAAALSDSTINFATGSAVIESSSQPLLARLAEVARNCPGYLAVEGHTDNVGNAEFNRGLSQERAQSVASALASLGIDSTRLQVSGYGMDQPIADNETASGRAQNRRIEIRSIEINN